MKEIPFGSVLTLLRKSKALTQRELDRALNIHITTIKNSEGAVCLQDAKHLCALADLFHVTTDYRLGREHSNTISLDGMTSGQRRQVTHIVQAYMNALPNLTAKSI